MTERNNQISMYPGIKWGLGFRIFFIDDNDSLKRISMAQYERLFRRERGECLKQYTGKRVCCAIVVIHNFRVFKKLLHLNDSRGILITYSAYEERPIPWLTLTEKNRL